MSTSIIEIKQIPNMVTDFILIDQYKIIYSITAGNQDI